MSQEGYDKLVAELLELERVELPRVKDAIAEARDKGDLSENFEYTPPSASRRDCWGAYASNSVCWNLPASLTRPN